MVEVIPILKADNKTDASKHWFIPMIPNFSRIFENFMYNRIKSFIKQNKLVSLSQYGFRKAYLTQYSILDIMNTIQTNMDKRLFLLGVFVDLKKLLTLLIITFSSRGYINLDSVR